MRVTSVPVKLAEEVSPHAQGAMGIRKGRTYRESRESSRSVHRVVLSFRHRAGIPVIFNY